MRAALVLFAALLAGCGPEPTSLLVHIDAPSLTITRLTVSATLSGSAKSVDLSSPKLPGNVKLLLPDVAQQVTIALAAVDDQHRNWTAGGTAQVTPHHQATMSLTLGSVLAPDDMAQSAPGDDMAAAPDMARPQLTLLAGVPGGGPDDFDGQGSDARLVSPRGVALYQGSVYVAEDYSGKIRKVTPDGAVTTLPLIDGANGTPTNLYSPWGLVADGKGNLYASTWNGCGVYQIRLSDNAVFTLVGGVTCDQYADGTAAAARFGVLEGIAIDDAGSLWVTDPLNHAIRRIAFDGSGNISVTTPAGLSTTAGRVDGAGNTGATTGPARLDTPHSIYFHGGKIYFGDGGAFRMLDPAAGNQVSTITQPGDNGSIGGMVFDAATSRFVVVDRFGVLRQIVPGMPPTNTVVAGDRNDDFAVDGMGLQARFNDLDFMTGDPQPGGKIWVSDGTALRTIDPAGYVVKTVAGTASHNRERDQPALLNGPAGLAFDGQHTVYFVDHWGGVVRQYDLDSGLTTTLAGSLDQPDALVLDGQQQLWIVCEGTSTIAKMTLADRNVTVIAGKGTAGLPPAFDHPTAIAFDGDHTLFIADAGNHLIRTLDTQGSAVGTLAGSGSQGQSDGDFASATFDLPHGLALDRAQQRLYVADAAAATVRVLDLGKKTVKRLAGVAYDGRLVDGALADARLNLPYELWLDAAAQQLYVADQGNHAVRIVDLGAQTIRTWVGDGKPLTQPGPLPARVHRPWGLAMTPLGMVMTSYAENALLLAR